MGVSELHSLSASLNNVQTTLAGPARPALGRPGKTPQFLLTRKAVNRGNILSAEPQSSAPFTNLQKNSRITHKSPRQKQPPRLFQIVSAEKIENYRARSMKRAFRRRLLFVLALLTLDAQITSKAIPIRR